MTYTLQPNATPNLTAMCPRPPKPTCSSSSSRDAGTVMTTQPFHTAPTLYLFNSCAGHGPQQTEGVMVLLPGNKCMVRYIITRVHLRRNYVWKQCQLTTPILSPALSRPWSWYGEKVVMPADIRGRLKPRSSRTKPNNTNNTKRWRRAHHSDLQSCLVQAVVLVG
jgi:hypothetical protein